MMAIRYSLKVSVGWGTYILWQFREWRSYFQLEDWRLLGYELEEIGNWGKGIPGWGKNME